MNVELLERVKQHILEEPNRLSMAFTTRFVENKDEMIDKLDGYDSCSENVFLNPPCGTAGCIAGWAYMLSGFKPTSREYIKDRVAELLDITNDEMSRLYYTTEWPRKYYNAFKTYDLTKRAQVCAERIDFFIRTDGTDVE